MANQQPDDVGLGHEPQNGNQADADSRPNLQLRVYDQTIHVFRSELSDPIQENLQCYGQTNASFLSIPQIDGDQTIHHGVSVQLPSDNRCTDSALPGPGQTRPFGSVQVDRDDLPFMSNDGVYYGPGAGSMSHQDSQFPGMDVEDQSVNPTVMQSFTGEQTFHLLPEGDRPRQLSDSDVSMESEEDATKSSPQHTLESHSTFQMSKGDREKSFRNAPDIFHSYSQLGPKHMAEYGFLYMGIGDSVKCFKCEAVLHTWDPHDDPLVEHIRHGPPDICPYLRSTVDQSMLNAISEQLKQNDNGELSHDIDETADKQQMSRYQMQLQQQQMLESTQEMSAASGNTAVFQSSNDRKERQIHRNADEDFLCQDCRRNKVNHTQRDCGHGICGECICCMKGTPMNGRRCVTCNRPVVGYSSWAPSY